MNEEYLSYRLLIMDLRNIARELHYAITYINIFEYRILAGLAANEDVSFDKRLNALRETLESKKNEIYDVIIPSLEEEKSAALAASYQ